MAVALDLHLNTWDKCVLVGYRMRIILLLVIFCIPVVDVHACSFQLLNENYRYSIAVRKAENFADSLPDIRSLKLPSDAHKFLESIVDGKQEHNPHLSWLRQASKQTQNGREIAFVFKWLYASFDWMPTVVLMGEGTQSLFVREVLKVFFPEAELLGRDQQTNRFTVKIDVADSAEEGKNVRSTAPIQNHLEMSILKMGNPMALEREPIRRLLPLHEGKLEIQHWYVATPKYITATAGKYFAPIAEQMARTAEPDVPTTFIVSSNRVGNWHQFSQAVDLPNTTINAFSMLPPNHKAHGENWLNTEPGMNRFIFNDTQGLKRAIDQFADATVVVGPINFLESLTGGTPTISVLNDEAIGGFNREVLEQQAELARHTGGYARVDSLNDVSNALKDVRQNKLRVTTPPYLVESNGSTPLEQAIIHLSRYLQNQMPLEQ